MIKTHNSTNVITQCRSCNSSTLKPALDLGVQSLSNRYKAEGIAEYKHPLILGFCEHCGLVQLLSEAPLEEVRPRFTWITYNEPEGHLDDVASLLAALPKLKSNSQIAGLTCKEESLLKRLQTKGFSHTKKLELKNDFGITEPLAGSETLQDRLTVDQAQEIVAQNGKFDLLIVRHILEHSYKPLSFLNALKELVSPSGYIMIEVPDCAKIFDTLDYSFIWEEHSSYFTLNTFRSILTFAGFEIISLNSYPYPYENCLVAILQANSQSDNANIEAIDKEKYRINFYAKNFTEQKDLHQKALSHLAKENGQIAVFGAGHLATHFINFLDLGKLIDYVLDDHPDKVGLKMPGSNIPIVNSTLLKDGSIKVCFSSLSPESNLKLSARQTEFLANGGQFYSIPRSSKDALPLP